MSRLTEEQKLQIIDLDQAGLSGRKIELETGVPRSTVGDFLRRESYQSWWEEYDNNQTTAEQEDKDSYGDGDLDNLCNDPDWHVANLAKRLRAAQRTNTQLRRVMNNKFDDDTVTLEDMLCVLADNLEGKVQTFKKPTPNKQTSQTTVEILFSDLQIGKLSECWDTETAKRALKYYGQEVMKIVLEANPERIIFSSLGDICECMLKHGIQSAVSTDTSNAEQMANAIEYIWWEVLAPLIDLGVPMEIVGVQGNHLSSTGKGMDMYKAGRYGYDYVMYKSWETMVKLSGADHVTFNIPEGNFATYTIYGQLTVAEHGYECKGSSESALDTLRTKRSTNLQQFVHRLVVGDMHHYCNYNNGAMLVNGAWFGVAYDAIEYSGIMGYHAIPAQVVAIHEPVEGVGQNTVKEVKVIQIAKGY